MPDTIAPLRQFVIDVTKIVDTPRDEASLLAAISVPLAKLIENGDWLPAAFATPHPQYYQQYLLYCDPLERFSVQSFVWGPGQSTPIHNHTVWGLVGVLRGAERCQRYCQDATGQIIKDGPSVVLKEKEIDAVSPTIGDLHTVSNARSDQPSISIHVYGANIGNAIRRVFKEGSAQEKPFVSGYSSDVTPNLWNRADDIRASLS
jgi:predicted metal-dependent enzyme (double-stranded beta helix superfamily)